MEGGSLDYVLGYEDLSNPFQTFCLEAKRYAQKLIIKDIKKRIEKFKEECTIDFNFTKELSNKQIGVISLSDCPERLGKMISASNQSNRTPFSLFEENKGNRLDEKH